MVARAQASTLPPANAGYLEPAYWDARFSEEETYEWFREYESFRHLVERSCAPSSRILVVGCGNSRLSEDLVTVSGLQNVTSTDLSEVVVERMRAAALARGVPEVTWAVADMLALPFPEASFDVIIEKGTLDVFLVDNVDPWSVEPGIAARVACVLQECHRVLTPTGALLSVTFSAPHFRRPLLARGRFTWRVACDTFGGEWAYHFYTCRKGLKREDEVDVSAAPLKVAAPRDSMHEGMDEEGFLSRTLLDASDDEG